MIPQLIEPDSPWLDVVSQFNDHLTEHSAGEIDSHVWSAFIKVNHSKENFIFHKV